jgi:hypothetical protein
MRSRRHYDGIVSKRFKNAYCTYCRAVSAVTGDHIFARELFLLEERDNLPQVPTCDQCNNEKSKLEHYLLTVMPFGGRHPQAARTLTTFVPKRLSKNQKLKSRVSSRADSLRG